MIQGTISEWSRQAEQTQLADRLHWAAWMRFGISPPFSRNLGRLEAMITAILDLLIGCAPKAFTPKTERVPRINNSRVASYQ